MFPQSITRQERLDSESTTPETKDASYLLTYLLTYYTSSIKMSRVMHGSCIAQPQFYAQFVHLDPRSLLS
jgi:hypothetical protein